MFDVSEQTQNIRTSCWGTSQRKWQVP